MTFGISDVSRRFFSMHSKKSGWRAVRSKDKVSSDVASAPEKKCLLLGPRRKVSSYFGVLAADGGLVIDFTLEARAISRLCVGPRHARLWFTHPAAPAKLRSPKFSTMKSAHFFSVLLSPLRSPNKPPEPTPTAGTSAAEQPLVPAAVVAHL